MTEELEQFELPETWQELPLNQAFRFTRKPKEVRYAECETIPFIPMELIPQGGKTQTAFVMRKPEDISSGSYFERGDVLLAKITPSFENGKQGIAADIPGGFGVASTEAIAMQSIPGQSCKHYLFYYLLKRDVRAAIARRMEGSTGRQRVPESVVTNWLMPVPPLAEQQKISAVLQKIQQAIETEAALARNARELKKATMRQLFTAGLRGEEQEETGFGDVPKSWHVRKIGSFSKLSSGGTPERSKAEYWKEGTIPWVKTAEVNYSLITDTEEKITELGLQNSAARLYPAGTLLIAMYGQGVTRGRVGILGIEATTNQACAAIIPDNTVLTSYLYHYLAYSYGRLRSLGHGANQQNLNSEIVAAFECPIPELEEQKEIADILDTLDRKIIVHDAKQRAWQDLFKTMLHKLMTAQIRVNDLDIDTRELEA